MQLFVCCLRIIFFAPYRSLCLVSLDTIPTVGCWLVTDVTNKQSSSFVLPPRPEPRYSTGKAGFVGDNIHQLTPSTTLEYRVSKFIDSLRPDIPDPPAEDAPYEYPYTQPCDPSSLPPPKRSQPADPRELKRVVLPVNPYAPSGPLGGADPYFAVNPVKVRSSVAVQQGLDKSSSRRPRRVRGETRGRREYDEASSQGEECARRMYRLHT
jgi:hypothetical protein